MAAGKSGRTRKLKWMKGVKMTEIFRSTRKCRTFEAFLQSRLRPLARRKHRRVNGTRGQVTKMTRGFTPCGSSMAATAPVVACWPEFSLDRYTYDGGWDIYAAGPPPPPQAWPLQPA